MWWLQVTARLSRQPACRRGATSRTFALSRGFPLRTFFRSHFHTSHSKMTPSPCNVEYGFVEGVEHLSDYRSGGYHPVHIDDRLHDRYRIVHKFGHGTFSTAWLAIDEMTSKYVAVKVGTADADRAEGDILAQLSRFQGEEMPLIPFVLDRFDVNGPNGTHPCLVTIPARCSLRGSREASDNKLFQRDVARSLAAQLVMAIALIHSHGIAHGDLHLGNILLQLSSTLDKTPVSKLYDLYGEPDRQPVVRLDTEAPSTEPGVPSYAVLPIELDIASDEIPLNEARLLLSDFGVAFRPSDRTRLESYTPLSHRPPEAFFEPNTPLTLASDIWSLGCVIFELFAHRSLIDGFLAPQDEITAQQVELQGLMPNEWWEKWDKRSKWYDEVGKPLSKPADMWSWDRRFEYWVQKPRRSNDMEALGDEEYEALLRLLKWMLAWKPEQRPTAQEVLESQWVTDWALPTYKRGLKG